MSRLDGSRKTGEQFLELSQLEPIEIEEVRSPPRRSRRRMGRIAIWLAIFTFLSTFWAGATNFAPTAALMHASESAESAVAAYRHAGQLVPRTTVCAGVNGNSGRTRVWSLPVHHLLSGTQHTTAFHTIPDLGARNLWGRDCHARGEADRRQIFDIGLAGPIAGLCVAIPILIYAIGHRAALIMKSIERWSWGNRCSCSG